MNVTAGNTKKRATITVASKLAPMIFTLFFLSVSRTRSRKRDRPAVWVCGIARGGEITLPAGSYTSSGSFHSPPSPQGEGKGRRAQLSLGFPLRGSCRLPRRLMRCSAPQSALSLCIQACSRGTDIAYTPPDRHSRRALPAAAVRKACFAEFAKQTKKGEKPRGELARTFGFNPFFLYCRVFHAAN